MDAVFMVVVGFCLSYLPRLQHPLSLLLTVFSLSVISCLGVGVTVSSWYGFVLFLVYIGALLVMFTYSTALAANPLFSTERVGWSLAGGGVFWLGWSSYGQPSLSSFNTTIRESSVRDGLSLFSLDSSVFSLLILASILFFAMVVVVKICSSASGALRG
uniref:NADH dehydrogenase subunit 6 n=1 Tax=Laternula elliptica TaxID=228457 RepID=U5TTU2_LATEL|nr:NADH dehydrogenase subunit 6 [Laternula elliptica]AGZ13053.1 NADH dehydrogenase subunit 6 [Laternula elliptica]AQZ26140.1 NADH dehydrogenase subunit 6 [Laternula elliptica]